MKTVYIVNFLEPEGFDTLGNARHHLVETACYGTKTKAFASLPTLIAKLPEYLKKPVPERKHFIMCINDEGSYRIRAQHKAERSESVATWIISITQYEVL